MTLSVTFDDPDEACRWLRHMSKFKRTRPKTADPVWIEPPTTARDPRWQAIEDKFRGLDTKNGRSGASHARGESRRDTGASQQ